MQPTPLTESPQLASSILQIFGRFSWGS